MCVEIYSHYRGYLTRQISHVSRFVPFHTKSGKITKLKGFFHVKYLMKKQYKLPNVCKYFSCSVIFSRVTPMKHVCGCLASRLQPAVQGLQTVHCEQFQVSFFDKHKGYLWLSGYGIWLNFRSFPFSQEDFPISPTIFSQLPVVCSWFVIFSWFAGSLWKNKFSVHVRVCKHNVRKYICSLRCEMLYYNIHYITHQHLT